MEPLWNGMRLLLPLICNSLFISLEKHCNGDLAFWSIRCMSTHIMIVPGEKCNNIGHSFAVYNRNMKRHKGISEDSPRWLRSPTPCSPILHTWHGLSSQYHHLGDPIRITRFYYSHKRRDWTGRLTLTRSRRQDQLIDISPINNWSSPVGQELILSDVPRCLAYRGECKEVTDTIYTRQHKNGQCEPSPEYASHATTSSW